MVDVAWYLDLHVGVGVLAEQGRGLAVEEHFHVGEAAMARGVELVRAGEGDVAGVGQGEFLVILGDDFEIGVVAERQRLLRRQEVGHLFQQVPGVGLVGQCGQGNCGAE
ncbi:hypothetical protein D9M73_155970 [compost metagenome]